MFLLEETRPGDPTYPTWGKYTPKARADTILKTNDNMQLFIKWGITPNVTAAAPVIDRKFMNCTSCSQPPNTRTSNVDYQTCKKNCKNDPNCKAFYTSGGLNCVQINDLNGTIGPSNNTYGSIEFASSTDNTFKQIPNVTINYAPILSRETEDQCKISCQKDPWCDLYAFDTLAKLCANGTCQYGTNTSIPDPLCAKYSTRLNPLENPTTVWCKCTNNGSTMNLGLIK